MSPLWRAPDNNGEQTAFLLNTGVPSLPAAVTSGGDEVELKGNETGTQPGNETGTQLDSRSKNARNRGKTRGSAVCE
jgi:hypothetical protein